TSCSGSPPATRRSSCRSATAARTTPSSSARAAASWSRARTTASRSPRRRRARRRTCRSTTAPSRASTSPSCVRARSSSIRRRGRGRTTPGGSSPSGSRRWRMPRRSDLRSICLIGSGPIVIGQACEFDYAGCQALKVLREDGFRTIVVNSNPATIMTDPGFADRTYLEPLDAESVAEVLRIERPDALLPTMGGQTALNLARELATAGVLDELDIELIGVHTGDSVTVAPQMTRPDEAYQELRDAAVSVIRAVGVDTGGSNIQFARSRETGEVRVIELNPRVSRSSALASKATGYPIAKVAARLAVGYTLDEIPNDLTGTTPASFEPTLDYIVVKFPR